MNLDEFNTRMIITTRWRDLDAMDHVNNATFLTYFEIVRMEYFNQIGITDMKKSGNHGSVVVSQTCNYRQQLHHPSTLDCGVKCVRIGNSSFTLDYAFYLKDTDKLVCDGTSTSAWIDYDEGKSLPMPDVLRDTMAQREGKDSL